MPMWVCVWHLAKMVFSCWHLSQASITCPDHQSLWFTRNKHQGLSITRHWPPNIMCHQALTNKYCVCHQTSSPSIMSHQILTTKHYVSVYFDQQALYVITHWLRSKHYVTTDTDHQALSVTRHSPPNIMCQQALMTKHLWYKTLAIFTTICVLIIVRFSGLT